MAPSATHGASDANAAAWSLSRWYHDQRTPMSSTAATPATAIVAIRARDPNGNAASHSTVASGTNSASRLVTNAPGPPAPRVVESGTSRIPTSSSATKAR